MVTGGAQSTYLTHLMVTCTWDWTNYPFTVYIPSLYTIIFACSWRITWFICISCYILTFKATNKSCYITCITFVMCSRYLCDVLRFSVDKLLSCISCLTVGLMYMWSLPMTDCYYTILEGNFIMQSAAERFWWLEPLDNNGKR